MTAPRPRLVLAPPWDQTGPTGTEDSPAGIAGVVAPAPPPPPRRRRLRPAILSGALAVAVAAVVTAMVAGIVSGGEGARPGEGRRVGRFPVSAGARAPVPVSVLAAAVPPGAVLHVSADPAAEGPRDGSRARPFSSINEALDRAGPGDVVLAGPGIHRAPVVTVRAGRPEAPIRVVGKKGAEIVGAGDGRVVQILHDHITFEGFDVSGGDILVWVFGATGTRIKGNVLHDAAGECIRLRYHTTAAEIAGNRIKDCGQRGFNLSEDDKNGEGVYIGTAPEQLDRNPTPEPDGSNRNWVHDNVVSVPAECVDVKEGALGNLVEHNTCRGGRDPDGAGFSSRGRETRFLANVSSGHVGAGIRLGGDRRTDGTRSEVRGNVLTDNDGYGLKVQRTPQGLLCENTIRNSGRGTTNGHVDPRAPC